MAERDQFGQWPGLQTPLLSFVWRYLADSVKENIAIPASKTHIRWSVSKVPVHRMRNEPSAAGSA
jgi:hypothetical protein